MSAPSNTCAATDSCLAGLLGSAREEGRPDSYIGRRRWTRYAIGKRLEVTPDPSKPGNTWVVRSHNISGGGLGFWSKHEVDKNATLYVREWSEAGGGTWLQGAVTYCTLGISGFLVGIAFQRQTRPDAAFDLSGAGRSGGAELEAATATRPGASFSMRFAFRSGAAAVIGMVTAQQLSRFESLHGIGVLAIALAAGFMIGGAGARCITARDLKFLSALRAAIRELASGSPSSISLPQPSDTQLSELRESVIDMGSKWRRHDDAERLQRQKLEELTRIKTNILSIVSHDLRTPLTSILLYARMLNEDLDNISPEDRQKFIGIIGDECARLSRLLDDLLEAQRLESGRVQWNMRPRDLAETVRAAAGVFEAMAREAKIEFSVNCPASLPSLSADADKISQVLSNLLSNALKYTPECGKVNLSAVARTSDILICVSDNGPGIPRDKWDQIFDRFSQLSSTKTREIAGVGLGLYIVKEIVQQHGGRVWVDSELGKGSDFYVSLPLKTAAQGSQRSREQSAVRGRVVFCDADPELGAMVAQTLRQENFEVQVVHSAGRLLEALSQGHVDVVITDVLLPDMPAPDLLDTIEQMKGRTFRLVLHSYENPELPLHRQWVDIFVERPASKMELIQAVRAAMQKKRSAGSQVILLLGGDDSDFGPLDLTLSARGNICVTARGMGAAAHMIKGYGVNLVVIDDRMLSGGWSELEQLDSLRNESLRAVVLCAQAGAAERRFAEAHEVEVVVYTPSTSREAIEAILCDRREAGAEAVS